MPTEGSQTMSHVFFYSYIIGMNDRNAYVNSWTAGVHVTCLITCILQRYYFLYMVVAFVSNSSKSSGYCMILNIILQEQ